MRMRERMREGRQLRRSQRKVANQKLLMWTPPTNWRCFACGHENSRHIHTHVCTMCKKCYSTHIIYICTYTVACTHVCIHTHVHMYVCAYACTLDDLSWATKRTKLARRKAYPKERKKLRENPANTRFSWSSWGDVQTTTVYTATPHICHYQCSYMYVVFIVRLATSLR